MTGPCLGLILDSLSTSTVPFYFQVISKFRINLFNLPPNPTTSCMLPSVPSHIPYRSSQLNT